MFAFTKSGKFGRAVKKALADKVITDDELAEIDRLQAELGHSEEKAKSVLRKQVLPLANTLTGRVLDRVKKTRRYSPDDDAEISQTRQTVEKGKRMSGRGELGG